MTELYIIQKISNGMQYYCPKKKVWQFNLFNVEPYPKKQLMSVIEKDLSKGDYILLPVIRKH